MSIYALLPEVASIMNTFSRLGAQNAQRLLNQLHQYGDLTDGQVGWMRLQGGAQLAFAFLSGTSGIASGFFPKGASNPVLPEANGFFESVVHKLQDNDFMRSTLKSASQFCHSTGEGTRSLIQAPITEDEAKRAITSQVHFQAAQEGQSAAQNAIDKANQLATSIIEKKSRG